MIEVVIVIGALLGFCVLTFGAAWLTAAWVVEAPARRRRKRRDRP